MRAISSLTALILGALANVAAAATPAPAPLASVKLSLSPSPGLPNPNTLPASTHATLSSLGKSYRAYLTAANTFVFDNVTAGSYLADVHCPAYGFTPLRIDVSVLETGADDQAVKEAAGKKYTVRAWVTYRGNDWDNKGEALADVNGKGFEIRALGRKVFFADRASCVFSPLPVFMCIC